MEKDTQYLDKYMSICFSCAKEMDLKAEYFAATIGTTPTPDARCQNCGSIDYLRDVAFSSDA